MHTGFSQDFFFFTSGAQLFFCSFFPVNAPCCFRGPMFVLMGVYVFTVLFLCVYIYMCANKKVDVLKNTISVLLRRQGIGIFPL